MMKRRLCAILAFVVFFSYCKASAEQGGEKALTLMVYMCGSDLESDYGCASDDMQEMISSRLDATQVNLVVLTGGAKAPGWTEPACSRLDELGNFEPVALGGIEKNMGEAGTLSGFLSESTARFPAREYALILWDHGGGPLEGLCYDEMNDPDRLSLAELASALRDSPFGGERKLAWIGFDACLMGSVETASVCAPYARYMIASEETEPAQGWDYRFLRELGGGKDFEAIGKAIVDGFMKMDDEKCSLTLSCIDLDSMDRVFSAMDAMYDALERTLNADSFSDIAIKRQRAKTFGRATTFFDYDLVDLYHLSQQYEQEAPDEAAALQDAISCAVSYSSTNLENSHGLSLYSPYYNKGSYSSKWEKEYKAWYFSPGYSSYMERYADIWMGKQLADWSRLSYNAQPVRNGATQAVALTLTDEQLASFASARLVILRETGEGNRYYNINEINDIRFVDHTLLASYDYSGLYAVDEKGTLLTDAYPFQKIDDYYYVRVILESEANFSLSHVYGLDQKEAGYDAKEVYLQYQLGEDGVLELVNVIKRAQSPDMPNVSRQSDDLDSSKWPYVFFLNDTCISPTYDADGALLPADKWETVKAWDARHNSFVDSNNNPVHSWDWVRKFTVADRERSEFRYWGEVDNRKPWSLRFLRGRFSGMDLYAQYIITDTQGNEIATELIPLDNPYKLSSIELETPIFSSSDLDVTLSGLELIDTTLDRGLRFRFRIRSDLDDSIALSLIRLFINQTPLDTYIGNEQSVKPHSAVDMYITLPAEELPPLEDGFVHSVSFSLMLGILSEPVQTRESPLFTLETELDLRPLNPMMEWPYHDPPLGEAVVDGVRTQLVRLCEREDGGLAGVLHIVNESGEERQIFTNSPDTYPHVLVNGCYMYNSLDIFSNLPLLPSGETYAEFTIDRLSLAKRFSWNEANGRDTVDIFDYWGIDRVDQIGFMYIIGYDIRSSNAGNTLNHFEISLETPLELHHPRGEKPPAVTIAETEGLRIDVRGILRDNHTVWLYTDLSTGAAAQQLTLNSCRLNDIPAAATLIPDHAQVFGQFPIETFSGMTERAIMEITLPPYASLDTLDRIELSFDAQPLCSDLVTAASAVITTDSGQAFPSYYVAADRLQVRSGDSVIPNSDKQPSGAVRRFNQAQIFEEAKPTVTSAANLVPAEVTLSVPVPEERLQETASASIMLLLPDGNNNGMFYASVIIEDGLVWRDGHVSVDFCGYLPVFKGMSAPLLCSVDRNGSMTRFTVEANAYLSGIESDSARGYISYDKLSFYLDAGMNTSGLLHSEITMHNLADQTPAQLYCSQLPLSMPERLYNGYDLPVFYADGAQTMTAINAEIGDVVIDFLPASDAKPIVMFIGFYKYGSGYSYIEPYDEAIQPR